jgi:antitoxin ParD1/3/4
MPTSIALTPHFESLTQELIASGRYNNVSEVVRDGLRLLESRVQEESAKLVAMKRAVKVGLDDIKDGNYVTLNNSQQIENFVRKAGERAAVRAKKAA